MTPASKFSLRKKYQDIRVQIPQKYRADAAVAAAKILSAHELFQAAEHIALYAAYKAELDVNPMMEAAWLAKKNCYLPVLTDDKSKQLSFVLYEYGDALHKNFFSILEPKDLSRKINIRELDLVILPVVAFDREGHRLGTGGGFYDYTFAFLQRMQTKKPVLVGAGYAAQETKDIPYDPWDVRLQNVVTEKEWIVCQKL